MRMRQLGATDLHLSSIGLGTWAIGGPWDYGWGPQDDAVSIATIHQALDLGINWIDTAPAYGLGHAEEVVGQAIRGRREQVIIATKCGLVWDDPAQRKVTGCLRADSIRREAEASLRRLGIETIDLYQIHWPNPDSDIEEAWHAIGELISAGKVRYAGASNFSTAQMERLAGSRPIASLQPPYSLLDRAAEAELLPYCQAHDLGVVAYGTMAYGLLTGKFDRASLAVLPAGDWRHKSARFQEPELTANLSAIAQLAAIAATHRRPLAHLAIAWVLRRTELTAAIVGARTPQQIQQTAPAVDWQLAEADCLAIDGILAQRDEALAGQSATGQI